MAPQFVDYNADGLVDIVTATFDGSPHVSLGSKKGFLEPERILDASGKPVMLRQFWNYETEKWDKNGAQPEGHCTSAVVFDWDDDGDLDLLLGSYGDGNLYLQMNEGKPGAPRFTGKNIPLEAGGKPFAVDGGITTPRLVDWNEDGLTDLLLGGYGDCYKDGPGGGVWVYLNVGRRGSPRFREPQTLIPPSKKDSHEAVRPDSGLFPEAVDYDGDGDLDLIVGGYSHWKPKPRELSEEEKARVEVLQASIREAEKKLDELHESLEITDETPAEEIQARFAVLRESEEYRACTATLEEARPELETLIGAPHRKAFVWLYRRSGTAP